MPAGRCGFVILIDMIMRLRFRRVPILSQLPIPWALRALVQRPLTATEELLEVLAQDAEPIVAEWARGVRGRIHRSADLADELDRLEVGGGIVARSLAQSVRRAWQEFGGSPLPSVSPSRRQPPLPLA